jgi:hypothetical protein
MNQFQHHSDDWVNRLMITGLFLFMLIGFNSHVYSGVQKCESHSISSSHQAELAHDAVLPAKSTLPDFNSRWIVSTLHNLKKMISGRESLSCSMSQYRSRLQTLKYQFLEIKSILLYRAMHLIILPEIDDFLFLS